MDPHSYDRQVHDNKRPKLDVKTDPESFARRYQLETFQRARQKNTIAYLETGSGKTLIAVLLIRAHAHLLRKPSNHTAVFLVPKVCLVHQQADVLDIHTDLRVGRFWGAMGTDLWDLKKWQEQLNKFEVFVMTPQILLDNLRHSFFKMEMIKVLIFDECHHARKKHPYACIMNEFYKTGGSELPLIFGMTASPTFSKGELCAELDLLEKTLHSTIFTLEDTSEMEAVVPTPIQMINYYDDKVASLESRLNILMMLNDLQEKHCKGVARHIKGRIYEDETKILQAADKRVKRMHSALVYCVQDLGLWCAHEAAGLLGNIRNDESFCSDPVRYMFLESVSSAFLQEAKQGLRFFLPSGCGSSVGIDIDADAENGLFTSKVMALVHTILDYRNSEFVRSIVFVQRVIAAKVLARLLGKVNCLSFLRCEHLAGDNAGLSGQNRNQQQHIIDQFRCGQVNLLVATNIVEEGLDIQNCKLVIRFDLPQTVCSLIQSRGRARKADSHFVLLIQSDNSKEEGLVSALMDCEAMMRQDALCRKGLHQEVDPVPEVPESTFRVESTGAIVNLDSSVALIYYYCSQLPSDRYFTPRPQFKFDDTASSCTLMLPPNAPLIDVTVHGQRFLLKRLVCLEACRKLHALNALTDHLLPVKEEDDEEITQDIKGHKELHPLFVPQILRGEWASSTENTLFHCYCISLTVKPPSWKFIRVLLLVESALDSDVANTVVQLGLGPGIVFAELQSSGSVELDADQVHVAKRFQEVVFNLLLEQTLELSSESIAWSSDRQYLLLPLEDTNLVSDVNASWIDWKCIMTASPYSDRDACKRLLGSNSCPVMTAFADGSFSDNKFLYTADGAILADEIEGCVVFTRHSEKYYCVASILQCMNAQSPFASVHSSKDTYCSYFDYYKKRHGLVLEHCEQPLLEAYPIFSVQNLLLRHLHRDTDSGTTVGISAKHAVEIPPELCSIVLRGLPINTLYTFSFLPSVMYRVEALLAASELRERIVVECRLSSVVPSAKILEALTRTSCQETFSLETLETLGDSFLKYAVSRHLFLVHSQKHEGQLTKMRMRATCNYTLYKLAVEHNIPGYVRTDCFDPKKWRGPGHFVSNESLKTSNELDSPQSISFQDVRNRRRAGISCYRWIKSKAVADVVEALIGAHLEYGGENVAMAFMNWLGIDVDNHPTLKSQLSWEAHPNITNICNIRALSGILKYSFINPMLLLEALTHASCQEPRDAGCYQRLEFLGDAALDFLITSHLCRTHPGLPPGLLTDLRSAAVNNECYGKVAAQWNLQRHLRHSSGVLHGKITEFVTLMRSCPTRNDHSFGWVEAKVPKVLGDLIESIAGAILVDSGFDTKRVWEVVKPLLEPIVTPGTLPYHPVRELLELCQKESFTVKFQKLPELNGTVVLGKVTIKEIQYEEIAKDVDKKTARKLSAQKLLKRLQDVGHQHPRYERNFTIESSQ